MKLTKKQRILNYAKQNPNGFTPKQLLADTSIKDKNIWVTLSQMKKAGVLAHDLKTSTYRLATSQNVEVLKPFNKKKLSRVDAISEAQADMVGELAGEMFKLRERCDQLDEQYTDALAIIRYLEGKLYTVIQRDARSQG